MDLPAARVVWYSLTCGLLVTFVWQCLKLLPARQAEERWLLGLTLVVMAKDYIRELSLGQADLALGVLVMAALAAAARRRAWLAGTCIAVAVFIKPYAMLFVPWLLWTLGLEAVLSFAIVLAVGLVAPATVYGWQGNIDELHGWYRIVVSTTPPNLTIPENISFAALWTKWIGVSRPVMMLAAATTAIAFAAVAYVARRFTGGASGPYREIAALFVLVPLISPQGWDYALLLGTPAVLSILDRWRTFSAPSRIILAFALVVIALPTRELLGLDWHRSVVSTGIVTLAAIALWAGVLTLRKNGA
jgi:hypothetical protein